MDKDKRRKKTTIAAWAVVCILIGSGSSLIIFPNQEAFQRQKTEQSFADEYLNDLYESYDRVKEQSDKSIYEFSDVHESDSHNSWEDDVWYVRDGTRYTPDYAKGVIQCVLEIPSVQIRRGVYTGTWEEIRHDLDIWMVTAARPDYELGKTHYCIYGHNHTVQNLSFNRLKDIKEEDYFTLSSEKGIFTYKVSEIFALWREEVTKSIVDNFSLSEKECFIITCGRGEYRYKDLIVKGILQSHQSIVKSHQTSHK